MEKRIPGSMRTREALSELIEGHLSTPDARSQLVLLATRLIVEEALEARAGTHSDEAIMSTAAIPAGATATGPGG